MHKVRITPVYNPQSIGVYWIPRVIHTEKNSGYQPLMVSYDIRFCPDNVLSIGGDIRIFLLRNIHMR